MRTPVWYHKAKLPIAVYNCSQKVLHVSPNWVKVSSRVQFIKVQPLTSCVSNTFCVPNFFQLRHLPNSGLLNKKDRQKKHCQICGFVNLSSWVSCNLPFLQSLKKTTQILKEDKNCTIDLLASFLPSVHTIIICEYVSKPVCAYVCVCIFFFFQEFLM